MRFSDAEIELLLEVFPPVSLEYVSEFGQTVFELARQMELELEDLLVAVATLVGAIAPVVFDKDKARGYDAIECLMRSVAEAIDEGDLKARMTIIEKYLRDRDDG